MASTSRTSSSSATVCIVLDKPKAKEEQIPIVVWIASSDDGSNWNLSYYIFFDEITFEHTMQLLVNQQQNVSNIDHVHLVSKNNTKKKRQSQTQEEDGQDPYNTDHDDPHLQNLQEQLSDTVFAQQPLSPSETAQSAPPLPDNRVECHPNMNFKAHTDSLRSTMRQLCHKPAWLSYNGDLNMHELEGSLGCLVNVLHMSSSSSLSDQQQCIQSIGPGKLLQGFLTVDARAAETVHLWPPATSGDEVHVGGTAQTNSIYGLLKSHCRTASGAILLKSWLRQPLTNLEQIVQRQDAVQCLFQNAVERNSLQQSLKSVRVDLKKLARSLSETTPTRKGLESLYDLYLLAARHLPSLLEIFEMIPNPPQILQSALRRLQVIQKELTKAEHLVEAVVDLELAPREFRAQSDYKPELQELLQELEELQGELEDHTKDVNEMLEGVSAEIRLETKEDTLQFRLPNANDSKILEQHGSIRIHRMLKNGVYFSTKELRQISNKQTELNFEYDKHQSEIVKDTLHVAATYRPMLEEAHPILATLDCFCALADLAAYKDYSRPELTDQDDAKLELIQARHPCVELQEGVDFIPNDCQLTESKFLIVTGPNMGGKSTYIRSLGAIQVLAQIGSFVPCQQSRINIVHHLLARVGAGDLQERGISTFMAEMLESSSILRQATKRSLIIIDELGRGTSTFDGYGLATAISKYIVHKIGCLTVFATHFHELTVLDENPLVKNSHVTAQTGSHGLTFLYEVRPGPCLESFGIQVAEMANVPGSVIETAKRKATALENFEYRKKPRMDEAKAASAVAKIKTLTLDQLEQYFALPEKREELVKFVEA